MAAGAERPVVASVTSGVAKTIDGHRANPLVPQSIQPSQIRHLTEVDLARRWRMSERTLQAWRWRKIGPPFIRLQGKVLYRLADIVEYEIANLRQGDR